MNFESLRYPRIALIGFRGVGKSTIGKLLAEKLGRRYVSMDSYIEKRNGMSIEDIVNKDGWGSFRTKESDVLKFFANRCGVLLDTGGGVMEDENGELSEKKFRILKNCFYCIYLYMNDGALLERLNAAKKTAQRPSLKGGKDDEILKKRKPWYEKLANYAIAIEKLSPGEVVQNILRTMKYD